MRRSLTSILSAVLLVAAVFGADAQDLPSPDRPSLIQADKISFDEELGVVTASGNVEISQGERVLLADSVSYNLRTDVVTAAGNVQLLEPGGEVIFANFVEITGDLREGFIRDVKVLMTDRSRLAGRSAQRTRGSYNEINKGVYSPCDLCKEDPTRPPLWQLKAQRVVHDQEDKTIRYHNAWMEMFGVPVAYTPYLQHPDPSVKRKTGLLAPTFGRTSRLGFTAQLPFFWNIAPNEDLTITPIITSRQNAGLLTEYRHAFKNGDLRALGSATVADRKTGNNDTRNDVFRGHIDAEGRFDVDDTWRWGFDANRSTDDTYLRVYKFSEERTLTSRLFLEGFRGRNYLSVNNFAYQGVREEDDNDELPIVAPLIDYSFESEPLFFDSTFNLDTNLLVLSRINGRESRRASLNGQWELPFVGPLGDLYHVSAAVAADGYWIEDTRPKSSDPNPNTETRSGLTGRVFPQLSAGWRFPFIQTNQTFSQIVEPVGQVIIAPDGSNPNLIPNEDSIDFEFDDTNIFSLNRFPGLDRVDPGIRFDYGMKWTILGNDGAYGSAFIGQSFRPSEIDTDLFPDRSGVSSNLSDVVGRLDLRPHPLFQMLYRFRFDKNNFAPRRSEVDARFGPAALNFDVTYTFLEDAAENQEFEETRQEIRVQMNAQLSRYWSIFGSFRRDIEEKDDLSWRGGITYEDECFKIEGVYERSFFRDRDVRQDDSFFVRMSFTNLGSVGGGS